MRIPAVWTLAMLLASGAVSAQQQNDALRKKLKDVELAGAWFYDDLKAGFAEAKRSGKPLLVVFR